MGLDKREKILFLRIADGKIRQKVDENNPNAEERYDEINGKYLYELVYDSCEGYLRDIKVQTHEKYGTSYSIILFDPKDGSKYSLQLSEESRYFQSMVMLLPNVNLELPLIIKPFSFKTENRANIGLSFEQDGKKVLNYYKDWDEESGTSTPKNGLEDFDFSEVQGDKEETKILQMKLRKFLKAELKTQIKRLLEHVEETPENTLREENDEEQETVKDENAEEKNEKAETQKSEKAKSKTEEKPQQAKKSTSKTETKKPGDKKQDKKNVPNGKKKKDLPY